MVRVGVITDNAASLPLDLARRLGIELVSQYHQLGGSGRQPELHLDEDYDGFNEDLISAEGLATSSAASVDDLAALYERLLEIDDSLVSVQVSSAISQTCPNARRAAAELDAEKECISERGPATGSHGGPGSLWVASVTTAALG